MKKPIHQWRFTSSSGASVNYETLLYSDGTMSCSCPGWTRRAVRTCKHTRAVEGNYANNTCLSHSPLTGKASVKPEQDPDPDPQPHVTTTKPTYGRKFL
jgi:hypothetical protein